MNLTIEELERRLYAANDELGLRQLWEFDEAIAFGEIQDAEAALEKFSILAQVHLEDIERRLR
jgi:hypothetical protein